MDLEGIVAKPAESPYLTDKLLWIKIGLLLLRHEAACLSSTLAALAHALYKIEGRVLGFHVAKREQGGRRRWPFQRTRPHNCAFLPSREPRSFPR